jgi:hypothetical protein
MAMDNDNQRILSFTLAVPTPDRTATCPRLDAFSRVAVTCIAGHHRAHAASMSVDPGLCVMFVRPVPSAFIT